jgi:hypothetical protein
MAARASDCGVKKGPGREGTGAAAADISGGNVLQSRLTVDSLKTNTTRH